jgi:hypothetical protein
MYVHSPKPSQPYTITLAMRTNAPTRLQSPNDNSHPCARDLDLAWQVLGTVARGPLPIKKKRIKKKRIGLSRAPGPYWLDNSFSCQSTPPAFIGKTGFEIELVFFYSRRASFP